MLIYPTHEHIIKMEFSDIKGYFGGLTSMLLGYIGLVDALNLANLLLAVLGGLGSLFLVVTSIIERFDKLKKETRNDEKNGHSPACSNCPNGGICGRERLPKA